VVWSINKKLPKKIKGEIKTVARQNSRIVVIEVVVEPIVVPAPLVVIPVEITNTQITVRVAICIACHPNHCF